jgi:formylglycine-generating enzyme required for sulfatase activity
VAVLFSLLALAGLGSGVAAGVFGLRKWRTEQKLFAAEKPADEQVSPPAVKEPSPEGNVASVAMPAPVDAALVESPLDPSVKGSEALARAFAEAPEAPVEMPCPEGMQFVPEGNFRMGTAANDADRGFDERNLSWVSVKAFCIDTYEFPNVAGAKPTASVGFEEATQSCVSKGKRLCREEEWEKACKGAENRRYPYGDAFDSASCNTEDELGEDRAIAGAGAFPRCRSGYGVVDLSGNVAEWTLTLFAGNADRAVKGGSSTRPQHAARCSARQNRSPTETSDELGFRCCADVK